MKAASIRTILAVAVAAGAASAAQATIAPVGSGVDAFFGSQGTGYMASNPSYVFTPPASGPLYVAGTPLPGVPAPPTPMVTTAFGNPFQVISSTSFFSDGLPLTTRTVAASKIVDNYNPVGTLVQDAAIDIPFWRLHQAAGASLYAYEQLNFYADYQVFTATPLLGSAPLIPLFVSGSVVSGGNVQFDAAITYSWADYINTSGALGPPTTLGTIYYQWQQIGGGIFSVLVPSTGTLASTPLGSTAGILELTGYAYLAGDPFDITITPEPASAGLLVLGGTALLLRRRRSAS
ncbi:MAG: PEP-CTERM sorting domain-containing protein [Phycisphaerae bacterium]